MPEAAQQVDHCKRRSGGSALSGHIDMITTPRMTPYTVFRYEEVQALLQICKMTGKLPDPENHAAKGFGTPQKMRLAKSSAHSRLMGHFVDSGIPLPTIFGRRRSRNRFRPGLPKSIHPNGRISRRIEVLCPSIPLGQRRLLQELEACPFPTIATPMYKRVPECDLSDRPDKRIFVFRA